MTRFSPAAPTLPAWLRPLGLLGLLVLLLLALAAATPADGRLHVFFFDTPGDAVLIQTPTREYVLIDGGADPNELALHLGQVLPFWQRHLRAVVLTSPDEQRLPGQIAALARYRADLALVSGRLPPTALTREWARLLEQQQTPLHLAQPGDRLALGGAVLTVLATGEPAAPRLVLRLDYGSTRLLLAGAARDADDVALQAAARPVTALAYPWQRELRTPLVAAWQPQAIIFTDAWKDKHPALLTSYERALGSPQRYQHLYHPEHDGTIELVSDGQHACLRRASEPPCLAR